MLLGIGTVYQLIATELDRRAYPPPGQLVDIGGYRLHVHTAGSSATGPTVILEGGAGLGSVTWGWVQPRVAEIARVVAYDRAGVGWSDPGPAPRDGQRIAAELHSALAAADIRPPYVLVGHSFGGLYVRIFADQYPDDVVGMVLVDATHPDQMERSPREGQAIATTERTMRIFDVLAHVGLLRVANPAALFMAGLPAAQDAELRAYAANGFARAAQAEMAAIVDHTFPQVRRTRDLGARPLVVLSAGQTLAQDPVFLDLHQELAALSRNGIHRVVDGASHADMVLNATFAEATISAIEDVVHAARGSQR
jgi:pimeloyl-ACP methyl ester carboxylesterase